MATQTAKKSDTAKKASAVKTVKVDFPADIFDAATNIALIHQVVVAQQAAARQGTASTKRRGEVRGGGRKPYKQKGTGRARQGSTRAPQFVGGGVVHGPHPRSYDQRTPKKMKAAALRGALSDRARAGRIHVIEGLVSGDKPSTKLAVTALNGISEGRRQLVVLERDDALTWLSLRNVPAVHLLAVDQLNTYDVLLSDDVIFTKGAYDKFVSGGADVVDEPVLDEPVVEVAPVEEPAEKPVKKAAAEKAPAKKTAAKTATDDEPAEKPAKKAAAKKAPAKKAPAKKAAPKAAAEEPTEAPEVAEEDAK